METDEAFVLNLDQAARTEPPAAGCKLGQPGPMLFIGVNLEVKAAFRKLRRQRFIPADS
jgi:hypothetical protein